jgi:hypothetical protein
VSSNLPPPPARRIAIPAWAGSLALLITSVLFCLGLLEAGARMAMARRPLVSTGEQWVSSQWDPVLGWRNRPHASVRYNRREFSTEVTMNSLGFRDVEHPTVKAAGFGRILALGDSFIEGFSVDLDDSLTRRAEALSVARGCRLDVVNAGVHAYSTDQEALWFEREAEPLHSDVVLLFVYYNDILNNVRENYWGSPKPVTRVIDDRIVPINLPLPPPNTVGEARIEFTPPPPIEGSALKSMVSGRMKMGAPRLYNLLAGAGFWPRFRPEAIPAELRAYKLRGQLEEFGEAWERTRALVGALGRSIRARHAEPVLIHVPARFEISERDWRLTTIRYGLDPPVWDRTLVRERLEKMAAAEGWAFLDLTPALQAAVGVFGGEPYFQFDGHWNSLGHGVAARAVVDFLAERSLLPCGGPVSR